MKSVRVSTSLSSDRASLLTASSIASNSPDSLKRDLQAYFSQHPSIIRAYCQDNEFVDRQTFDRLLESSKLLIDDACLEEFWNACEPTDSGVPCGKLLECFAPSLLESNKGKCLSANQCRVLNYITRIADTVRKHGKELKEDFSALDRYGRLFIATDEAINLMKCYAFPLNDQQLCELVVYFSSRKHGRFHYYDFMDYFTTRTKSHGSTFSRSTHLIQSKQAWIASSATVGRIFDRIRTQCIANYGSVHRMFGAFDRTRQGYLSGCELNCLLRTFGIRLDAEELYHIVAEIDKNQDGRISYEELYESLINDALQM